MENSVCYFCHKPIAEYEQKYIDKNNKESHAACYAKWVEQKVAEGIAYYESKRRQTNVQIL